MCSPLDLVSASTRGPCVGRSRFLIVDLGVSSLFAGLLSILRAGGLRIHRHCGLILFISFAFLFIIFNHHGEVNSLEFYLFLFGFWKWKEDGNHVGVVEWLSFDFILGNPQNYFFLTSTKL